MLKYLLIISTIIGLISCGPKVVFEEEQAMNQGWRYDQIVSFDFEISDTIAPYDMKFHVKHDPEFAWQNFYTQVSTVFPDGKEIKTPLSIELANKSGMWLSDCGNNACKLDLLLRKEVKFPQTGKYKLIFQQDSRENPLKGIQSIGLSISEAASK